MIEIANAVTEKQTFLDITCLDIKNIKYNILLELS